MQRADSSDRATACVLIQRAGPHFPNAVNRSLDRKFKLVAFSTEAS